MNKNKKIRIAIGTYNRKEILETCICSLAQVRNLEYFDVYIYDDASSDYDEAYLKDLISFASRITRNPTNFKSCKNMHSYYSDFLNSESDFLLQIDSDMIFNESVLEVVMKICELNITNAVFSFYNSNNHLFVSNEREELIQGVSFGIKEHIGAASVLFPKQIIKDILSNVKIINEDYSYYDWKWSEYLCNNKIPIYVTENSLMQHIGGIIGENHNQSDILSSDFGYGFTPTNIEDIQFLERYYNYLLSRTHIALKDYKDNFYHINKERIPSWMSKLGSLLNKL